MRFRTSRPKSSASAKLADAEMKCCSGCRPRYHAGKRLDASSDLPCLGGTKSIRRSISPRSTRSNCEAICRCRPAVSYLGYVNSVKLMRLVFAARRRASCSIARRAFASKRLNVRTQFLVGYAIEHIGSREVQFLRQHRRHHPQKNIRALLAHALQDGRAMLLPMRVQVAEEFFA